MFNADDPLFHSRKWIVTYSNSMKLFILFLIVINQFKPEQFVQQLVSKKLNGSWNDEIIV